MACTTKEHEVEEASLKSSTKEPNVEKKPIMKTKFTSLWVFEATCHSNMPTNNGKIEQNH